MVTMLFLPFFSMVTVTLSGAPGLYDSQAAGEKQNENDNQYHPEEARRTIAVGVIAPGGQTTKQEQN
jgi:hypothetical protein